MRGGAAEGPAVAALAIRAGGGPGAGPAAGRGAGMALAGPAVRAEPGDAPDRDRIPGFARVAVRCSGPGR